MTEHEYTGTVPYTFDANGSPLIDWNIGGANGGVGDKTQNLYNYKSVYSQYVDSNGIVTVTGTSMQIKNYFTSDVIDKEITISVDILNVSSSYVRVQGYADGNYINGDAISTKGKTSITITPKSTSDWWRFTFGAGTPTVEFKEVMVNEGNTAAAYEPYGFIIPVTCGGKTINILVSESLGAADSISMTDTGISIPTVDGSNTLSVGTTVRPSSVYIKYKEGGDEMVTLAKIGGRYNTPLLEIRGLSTDTKPTIKIEGMVVTNGSTYIEIDTGDTYMFDAENGVWHNITG